VATLCDSAADYNGKLCVLGAFDTIFAKTLPVVHPQCAIALRICFRPEDGPVLRFRISLIDGDGKDDFSGVAEQALDDIPEGVTLLDANSALEGAFSEANTTEDGHTQGGERSWRPYDQSHDEVRFVTPSKDGKAHDKQEADALYQTVRMECAYLRSRMRSMFQGMQMTSTAHGVQRGRRLSPRFLVDSRVTLMAGQMPKRAYQTQTVQPNTSVAAAVVLDQSSSMWGRKKEATKMLMAAVEPFDSLPAAVLAMGFRDGAHHTVVPKGEKNDYHRTKSVVYDIFKAYDERFSGVRWRFANTTATGYTPMSDGVQFALNSLQYRPETHKFVYLITDGLPDSGHLPVIKKQLRQCRELGICLIGVGVGKGAEYICGLIPNDSVAGTGHVYDEELSNIPPKLIKKTNDLLNERVFSRRTA
jgi:hypothetical protein